MRRLGLAAAGVLLALAVGVVATRSHAPAPDAGEAVAIGGPFTLQGADGRAVSEQDFRGRWTLVYFGYTHCPDVCPATLGTVAEALTRLPPAARGHIVPLFITVDPARDTPAVVGAYAKAFGPDFVGLSGTPAQIGQVAASYHVYASRRALKDGDYAMDHSSILYVMGPDGAFRGVLEDNLSPEAMAAKLVGFGV